MMLNPSKEMIKLIEMYDLATDPKEIDKIRNEMDELRKKELIGCPFEH